MAECDVPAASVAKVAMSHGINVSVVHGWRKLVREAACVAMPRPKEFIPIRLPQPSERAAPERSIEVKMRCGALTMKTTLPPSAMPDFAAWTRELLR